VAGDGDEVHHNLRLACRDSGKCVSVGGSGGAGGGGGDIAGDSSSDNGGGGKKIMEVVMVA
jgi:hypothetical protein